MSQTYGGMYDWSVKNTTSAELAPFSAVKIAGWENRIDDVFLLAEAASDDGPHAITGPIAIPADEDGACAFPGAHWAETTGDYPGGTEVGPVAGEALLTEGGAGFLTVGPKNANGQVLVAVRGGGSGASFYRAIIEGSGMSGAAWVDVAEPGQPPEMGLHYGSGFVFRLVEGTNSDNGPVAFLVDPTPSFAKNPYTKGIIVSGADRGLIGSFLNGVLLNVDCSEIEWTRPPEEPPA